MDAAYVEQHFYAIFHDFLMKRSETSSELSIFSEILDYIYKVNAKELMI